MGNKNSGRQRAVKLAVEKEKAFVPVCPRDLPKAGRVYFKKHASICVGKGTLTEETAVAFRRLCELHHLWRDLFDDIGINGTTYENKGRIYRRPEADNLIKIAKELTALEKRFALVPEMTYQRQRSSQIKSDELEEYYPE